MGVLACFWLPPYVLIRRAIADSNTVSILAVALLFIEFVGLLWLWAKRVHGWRKPLPHYGLSVTHQNRQELVYGLAIGCLSLLALFGLEGILGWISWQPISLSLLRIGLEGLLVALGIGIGEELIFRGWLLDELDQDYSPAVALWSSSLIFAVLHYLKPLQDLLAALFGFATSIAEVLRSLPQFPGLVLLGCILVWAKRTTQGRLGLSIGLHGGLVWGYYLINVGELVRYTDRVPAWVTGVDNNPLAGAMGMLALGAIGVGLKRRST